MRTLLVALALLLALGLSACGNSPAPGTNAGGGTPGDGKNAATADAATIYKQNCASCHGGNLEGGGGPKLQTVGAKLSKDQIAGLISNGRGGMPAFKNRLSETDIGSLSDWLAAKK